MCGILHPVILMPKQTDWKNIEQLQYIFSHEYVHISRYDTNCDIELACDESVIRQFGKESKSAYSLMLIHMNTRLK